MNMQELIATLEELIDGLDVEHALDGLSLGEEEIQAELDFGRD